MYYRRPIRKQHSNFTYSRGASVKLYYTTWGEQKRRRKLSKDKTSSLVPYTYRLHGLEIPNSTLHAQRHTITKNGAIPSLKKWPLHMSLSRITPKGTVYLRSQTASDIHHLSLNF